MTVYTLFEDGGKEETYGIYPENVKSAKLKTYDDNGKLIPLSERFDNTTDDIRYDLSEEDTYAPTFYSHMSRTIDGMKEGKYGANSVVPYLKGKAKNKSREALKNFLRASN